MNLPYISALLAVPFSVAAIGNCRWALALGFGATAAVLFVGAILFERRLQDDELSRLQQVPTDKLDQLKAALFS